LLSASSLASNFWYNLILASIDSGAEAASPSAGASFSPSSTGFSSAGGSSVGSGCSYISESSLL
jgi:hypothetical protein